MPPLLGIELEAQFNPYFFLNLLNCAAPLNYRQKYLTQKMPRRRGGSKFFTFFSAKVTNKIFVGRDVTNVILLML